ncbi:MAG: hypothetical protein K6T78_10140 [Alicyclobacillus sp.]|nr:hypothetical protein [Alicyclobacillus sp.]
MGRLTRYGIATAPAGPITTLLKGTLDLWSYDYRRPSNALRDQSQRLRNVCDEALAQYTKQLQQELRRLRQSLPEPTRENPYPPMEGLAAVKELESYIREVEGLRNRIVAAATPPNEFVRRSEEDNSRFFAQLAEVDKRLLAMLADISEDTLSAVDELLQERAALLHTWTLG